MEKFDQYAHKEQYSLPRTAKLVGFVVVNEEKEDMLAFLMKLTEFFDLLIQKLFPLLCVLKQLKRHKMLLKHWKNLYSYLLSMKLKVNILLPAL